MEKQNSFDLYIYPFNPANHHSNSSKVTCFHSNENRSVYPVKFIAADRRAGRRRIPRPYQVTAVPQYSIRKNPTQPVHVEVRSSTDRREKRVQWNPTSEFFNLGMVSHSLEPDDWVGCHCQCPLMILRYINLYEPEHVLTIIHCYWPIPSLQTSINQ